MKWEVEVSKKEESVWDYVCDITDEQVEISNYRGITKVTLKNVSILNNHKGKKIRLTQCRAFDEIPLRVIKKQVFLRSWVLRSQSLLESSGKINPTTNEITLSGIEAEDFLKRFLHNK
ncbi:hypothetical protein [Priestia flexa]|uniref:hypothetical protein n=1 Tax=Priestia flexa TaxID=86664 RepID=UPI002492D8D6|nr:hypothetical protein [Priestia flexa]